MADLRIFRLRSRAAFLMTEPEVASSDATNIQTSIRRDGDHYVINARKWWSSGTGDPRFKVAIVLGKTDPDAPDLPPAVHDPCSNGREWREETHHRRQRVGQAGRSDGRKSHALGPGGMGRGVQGRRERPAQLKIPDRPSAAMAPNSMRCATAFRASVGRACLRSKRWPGRPANRPSARESATSPHVALPSAKRRDPS